MKIFKYSAIAAIVIAIIGIVACNKNNPESYDNQTTTKAHDHPHPGIYYCYYYHNIAHGMDTCLNGYEEEQTSLSLCYIDMTCVEQYEDDPEFPIIPPNGIDPNVILCLPNYSQENDRVEQMFNEYFAQGEITFTCDCPAGTPTLMQYLPEGYLPAGTYPISKHGNDAWIDITSAVH